MVKVVFSRSTNAKKKMTAIFYKDGKKIKTTHFGASGYDDYTKTKDKKKTSVYDISDDLTYKSHVNHTMKHLDERIKIYTNEKFKYKITRINL